MIENNLHNFNKFAFSPGPHEHSRLFLILAISAALIGAELSWFQIINTDYDIESYSANIYSVMPNRNVLEAARLSVEVDGIEVIDTETDFQSIDRQIDASL